MAEAITYSDERTERRDKRQRVIEKMEERTRMMNEEMESLRRQRDELLNNSRTHSLQEQPDDIPASDEKGSNTDSDERTSHRVNDNAYDTDTSSNGQIEVGRRRNRDRLLDVKSEVGDKNIEGDARNKTYGSNIDGHIGSVGHRSDSVNIDKGHDRRERDYGSESDESITQVIGKRRDNIRFRSERKEDRRDCLDRNNSDWEKRKKDSFERRGVDRRKVKHESFNNDYGEMTEGLKDRRNKRDMRDSYCLDNKEKYDKVDSGGQYFNSEDSSYDTIDEILESDDDYQDDKATRNKRVSLKRGNSIDKSDDVYKGRSVDRKYTHSQNVAKKEYEKETVVSDTDEEDYDSRRYGNKHSMLYEQERKGLPKDRGGTRLQRDKQHREHASRYIDKRINTRTMQVDSRKNKERSGKGTVRFEDQMKNKPHLGISDGIEVRTVRNQDNTTIPKDILIKEESIRKRKEKLELREAELVVKEKALEKKRQERAKLRDITKEEEKLRKKEEEIIKREKALKNDSTSSEEGTGSSNKHLQFVKFSCFSGEEPKPKTEVSYGEWKYEVNCLKQEKAVARYLIAQAIRKSLRGQAKRVLLPLGTTASVNTMLGKLEGVFGVVATGETILAEFYTAKQKQEESVTAWGLRLEEILQKAVDKNHIKEAAKNEMLRTKFWRYLRSERLKNATRTIFERTTDYETLIKEVRSEEYEMKIAVQHQPTTTVTDQTQSNKFDLLLKKIESLEKDMKELKTERTTGHPRSPWQGQKHTKNNAFQQDNKGQKQTKQNANENKTGSKNTENTKGKSLN